MGLGFAKFWGPNGPATMAAKSIMMKEWGPGGDGTTTVTKIHKNSHTKLSPLLKPSPAVVPPMTSFAAERMHQLVTDAAVYADHTRR